MVFGQFITTSAEVTPKGSLSKGIRIPKWPKHSGSGFIINCPDGKLKILTEIFLCTEVIDTGYPYMFFRG